MFKVITNPNNGNEELIFNNYKITFNILKKKFQYQNYDYICQLKFYDSQVDTLIYTINITNVDLFKYLDHTYYMMSNNLDSYFLFNNTSPLCSYDGFRIIHEYNLNIQDYIYKLIIFNYNKQLQCGSNILTISCDYEELCEFMDMLTSVFILDTNEPINNYDVSTTMSDEMSNAYTLMGGYYEQY